MTSIVNSASNSLPILQSQCELKITELIDRFQSEDLNNNDKFKK